MENKNCKNTKDAQNTQNNTQNTRIPRTTRTQRTTPTAADGRGKQTSGIAGKAAEFMLRGLFVVCGGVFQRPPLGGGCRA